MIRPQRLLRKLKMDKITREQVERAKVDRTHVAIRLMDNLGESHWQAMRTESEKVSANREVNGVYMKALVPYSQELEKQDFSLQPLDVISIWSKRLEITPSLYFGYRLAGCLALAYGSNAINSPDWKNLYSRMSAGGEFNFVRTLSAGDKTNARIFRDRLKQISKGLEAIDEYHLEGKPDVNALIKKAISGDAEAREELERIQAKKDDVIDSIHENWGNGFYWMFASINDAVGRE